MRPGAELIEAYERALYAVFGEPELVLLDEPPGTKHTRP
jgi:hypothetical protein